MRRLSGLPLVAAKREGEATTSSLSLDSAGSLSTTGWSPRESAALSATGRLVVSVIDTNH
jgi:hypothetical protein